MIVERSETEELPQIGVDIMRVALPRGETNTSFIKVLNDQASSGSEQKMGQALIVRFYGS